MTVMNPMIKPTLETSSTMQDFPPPMWLKHLPSVMMPYAPFDGRYFRDTDAKYLSVGRAQWRNEDDPDAVSAKVWRYVGDKWSRQSEELPLRRLVDLCIFLTKAFYQSGAPRNFGPAVVIESGTFENQTEEIALRRLEPLPKGFEVENEEIKRRLRKLLEELRAANLDSAKAV
jgi:hypothetical protein